MKGKLLIGCCKEQMKLLPDNSIDSIVTDPPYELGFMGKSWDNTGIAYDVELWKECLRVLKHGGHLLAFGGTRTYHRMAVAIEDAGFEVRDMIEWVYGSGFPKSLNIGKAVDKIGGESLDWFIDYILKFAEEKGISKKELTMILPSKNGLPTGWLYNKQKTQGITIEQFNKIKEFLNLPFDNIEETKREVIGLGKAGLTAGTIANFQGEKEFDITKGNSEWEGWGTALKPAHEPICMARKPLAEKTIAENCLKWGVGGINIDESRVGEDLIKGQKAGQGFNNVKGFGVNTKQGDEEAKEYTSQDTVGRFPANLIHDNSEEVQNCFPNTNPSKKAHRGNGSDGSNGIYGVYGGESTIRGHDDNGGNASRFFKSILYYPKASKSERNKGINGEKFDGVDIIIYLCGQNKEQQIWKETLITREGQKASPLEGMDISLKKVIDEYGVQLSSDLDLSIISFGKTILEKSLMDTKYTTEMKINSIILQQTLNWLPLYTTKDYIQDVFLKMMDGISHVVSVENQNTLTITIKGKMESALGAKDVVLKMLLQIKEKEKTNFHATVKPVALISYLIKLITPKGGTVLDPFGGSGTTAVSCIENNFNYVIIEKEADHIPIIEARVKAATKEEAPIKEEVPLAQLSLFD